jgi:hypothetical protein
MTLALDPRHGMHEPTTGTPLRRPGSVRRTATTDILRFEGISGPLHLVGRARDLATSTEGAPRVLREARTTTVVDYPNGQVVASVTSDPVSAGTADLVGRRAASGFRTFLDEALPAERAARAPLFLLLDDIPVTTLISGHVLGAERDGGFHYREAIPGHDMATAMGKADLCAGWREGGTIMLQLRTSGSAPAVTGPAAPDILSGDPHAWHPVSPLGPRQMRRHRRLDVVPEDGAAGVARIDAMFRDTYVVPDGIETIIHEYEVHGTVDRASRTLLSLESVPRVLPWQECPSAAASAGRLVGADLRDVRSLVRSTFGGTSTCTHLNDALRSLEDVVALLEDLPEGD